MLVKMHNSLVRHRKAEQPGRSQLDSNGWMSQGDRKALSRLLGAFPAVDRCQVVLRVTRPICTDLKRSILKVKQKRRSLPCAEVAPDR